MPVDYEKYPKDWKTKIRPRIMDRANNRCEFEGCDFKHLEYVWSVHKEGKCFGWFREHIEAAKHGKPKAVKVILTIAHLDHDEENHEVKDHRLKAACQLHHLRYDQEEKRFRKLFKDCPILLNNWRP